MINRIKNTLLLAFVALFAIACEGTSGAKEEPIEGNLVIVPAQQNVVIGADSWLTFTATVGDTDVSDYKGLQIYFRGANGSEEISGNSCTIEGIGDYVFFGILDYGGEQKISADVMVTGVSQDLEAVADPEPDKFDSFARRTMAIQFTGTWCQNCPVMMKGIHDYADGENGDDVVFIAAHSGDDITSSAAVVLQSSFNISSFPSLRLGSVSVVAADNINNNLPTSIIVDDIDEAASKILVDKAKTAISVNTVLVDNQLISVRADVKVAEDGEYGVGSMVLEDDIYSPQTTSYNETTLPMGGVDINVHDNCLIAMDPMEKPMYKALGDEPSHSAGSVYLYKKEYRADELEIHRDFKNCRVVVYTFDKATNLIDNIVELPLGSSQSYDYE